MVEIFVRCKCGNDMEITEFEFPEWKYCHKCGGSLKEQGIDIAAMIAAEREKERRNIEARTRRSALLARRTNYCFRLLIYGLAPGFVLLAAYCLPRLLELQIYTTHKAFFDHLSVGNRMGVAAIIFVCVFLVWTSVVGRFVDKKFPLPRDHVS